jgi:periplasmic copper chaperone A
MKRALRRVAVGSGVVVATVGLLAASASAHVTIVSYGEVPQGGFGTIGFNVPNERDDAGTVTVEVQMPTDHPIPFVSVQPKPGWDVETTMRTLDQPIEGEGETVDQVVDSIKWTATGDTQIGPGQFDQFWISAGPLPTDVDSLEFPALQTYDDGDVVRWIDPTPASGEEPEHPVPAVALAASGGEAESPDAGDTGDTDDGDSNTLAVIALVVGGLALIAAVGGLVVSRRRGA